MRRLRHTIGGAYAARASRLRRFISAGGIGVAGGSAVEFALVTPVLALTLVSLADLSLGIYRKMEVQNAAQAGATYAMVNGFNANSITSAVTQATTFSVSASPAPTQFCGCASMSGVSTVTCGSTCSGGSSAGTYVTVSAQATYNTLLSYPGVPSSWSFSSQSTVRIQ
jgi:Flp pilus assembly protein TadG